MAMRMVKLAAATALLAGLSGSALAADLDRIIYSPQIDRTVPVEIGNGWYLRGDIGYAVESDADVESITFGGIEFDAGDVDPSFTSELSGGVGVGYQFTDFLRADFTAEYSEGEGAVDSGGFNGEADFDAITLMANGYIDLGTFVGITPYVGAGIGSTHVDWGPVSIGTPPVEVAGSGEWRLTYALMAGASYDLTKAIKLDFGYRYIDVAGHEIYDDSLLGSAEDDGYSKHEIRAGFRYMLW
jgi:opacity protein-like surface antigen